MSDVYIAAAAPRSTISIKPSNLGVPDQMTAAVVQVFCASFSTAIEFGCSYAEAAAIASMVVQEAIVNASRAP